MKKFTLLLLMAIVSMTARAYTYYSNIEIGNFKYSQLGLGSSSSEENYAFLSGLSSTASTSLTTLDIPGYVIYNGNRYRVKQINQNAFHNNTKITNVTFGYGVEYISSYVFDGCTALKYVNLPSSVKEIGQFVFQNCTSLLVVAFAGEKAPKIYDYTFNNSSTTKKASTATYRGMNALKADSKWVAAFGADNIKRHYSYTVGDFKVYNSTNGCWQYYTIKNGIPYNSNSSNPSVRSMCTLVAATFTDGSNYTISLPQTVGNSDNNAPGSYKFYGVADSAFMGNTAITKVTNNSTMAYKIGNAAFRNCSNLQSADVPVDTIGDYAFYNCQNLSSVNFASSLCNLAYLGHYAFGKCNISDVTIPQTTKYIGYAPFYNNSLMTDITVDANNTNYSSFNNALYNKQRTVLYQVPGKWIHASATTQFPETLQRILQYAAAGCWETSLVLPYNLTTIDQYAFQNCKNLKTVHFPSSITSVNANAFTGCDAVNRVELNLATAPSIDYFPDVTDKSSVMLYYANAIGAYDSYHNSSIWSQYNIQCSTVNYDFQNCWDIKNGIFYYTVTSTNSYQYGNSNYDGQLKIVAFQSGQAENYQFVIPTYVSYGGKKYVPTEIGTSVVKKSEPLFSVKDNGTIKKLGFRTFYETKIKDFTFSNLEEIGDRAFGLTKDLKKEINVLPRLKKIDDYAFYGSGITKFEAPTSLTSIGGSAFDYCKDLHEIFLPHIDGEHEITCGRDFFRNNASDFKCWVDYRRLKDFTYSSIWNGSKIYPHLLLDSEWQSFACYEIDRINFEGSGVEAYVVSNYNPSDNKATLNPITSVRFNEGIVVHGNVGTYYRLDYGGSSSSSSTWTQGVVSEPETVNSNSSTSYFKLNPTKPQFDKITSSTTFKRGYAYLKIPTSQTGGATTIYTNLSGSGGIPGDVNGDGEVTAADVTALYDVLLNNDYSHIVNGDQTGDDDITAADITAVYTILLSN